MKQNNVSVVLNAIRRHGAISRKDLAAITGLTAATITNIVGEIYKEDLLIELGEGESGGGRKPIMIGINPNAKIHFSSNLFNCIRRITATDVHHYPASRNKFLYSLISKET